MVSSIALRRWLLVHKWTSLVCTVFLLASCVTGLPLLFQDEIGQWLSPQLYAAAPAGAPRADLDRIAAISRRLHPGEIVTSIFIDDDEPQIEVSLAPSWTALKNDPDAVHVVRFDARTARVLERAGPLDRQLGTLLGILLHLHTDLFAGLAGELFLGLMGFLFVAAVVSGVVLYGPFAGKLGFGVVRAGQSRRLKWLDLHNLLGVVTVAWALVVGLTGVMNELSTPLFTLWQETEVRDALRPWQGKAPHAPGELGSVEAAYETVRRALPDMTVISVVFPGSPFGTPYHYLLWAQGNTPLTSRLFKPVLVDARSGVLAGVVPTPWYLSVLELSRPLHFGDYGGLPLKIIWALLDLVTIAVLGSGLYLWLSRRKSPLAARIAALELAEAEAESVTVRSIAE